MAIFPNYIGPAAFGVKMGVIVPGFDLISDVVERVNQCNQDGLLDDGDVLCITESVLARAQDNFVTLDEIAAELTEKLHLQPTSRVGVVFPILSRNRFAMTLEAIAKAVPEGEVILQLSWPADEVGNQIISDQLAEALCKEIYDVIYEEELNGHDLCHPITQVDYARLYKSIIQAQGAKATVLLANNPKEIGKYNCDGIIVADIHTRHKTKSKVDTVCQNVITLADLCNDPKAKSWSEWGLLGSNMSAAGKLKLAPRNSQQFAEELQEKVIAQTGKYVEVIVYGDGAYKDPSTGIYELADPEPVLAATAGFSGKLREGIKYKYFADIGYSQGKSVDEIEAELKQIKESGCVPDSEQTEGTTPRRLQDVIASLADLVSGSADAGTPLIIVKGFLNK